MTLRMNLYVKRDLKMNKENKEQLFDTPSENIELLALQQENERLKEEVQSYKNQIDEFINMSDQLQNQHNQCISLNKQIRTLNSEKDDIQNRLTITLKMNQELKEQLQREKSLNTSKELSFQSGLYNGNNNMNNNKINDLEKKITELEKQDSFSKIQIRDTKIQLEAEKSQKNELQNLMNIFIKSINGLFDESLTSFDDIIKFLSKKEKEQNELVKNEVKQYKINIKKLKKLLKDEKNNYSNQIKSIESEINQQNEIAETKINDLVKKLAKAEDDFQTQQKKYEVEIKNKEKQIQGLQNLLDKKEKETSLNSDKESKNILDYCQQIEEQKAKIIELQKVNTMLRRDNGVLNTKLSNSLNMNENLKKSMQKTDENYRKLSSDYDELKSQQISDQLENEKLNEQCKSNDLEIKTLKSTIEQKILNSKESENKIKQLNNSIAILENVLQTNQGEIKLLYYQRDKTLILLHKQAQLLQNYDKYITRIKEETLNNSKREEHEPIIVEKEEEKIPLTSWCTTEFPSTLCNLIIETAKEDNIPTLTKLRYVLNIIAKYYNKIIEDIKNDKESISKQLDDKNQISLRLITDITNIVGNTLFPPEELISDYSKCIILTKNLSEMKNDIFDKENKIKKLNDNLLNIYSKLNVNNNPEALVLIDKLKDSLSKQSKQIEYNISQFKKYKRNHQTFKNSCIQQQNEIEEIVNKQTTTIKDNQNEIKELKSQLKKLQILNYEYKQKIEKITNEAANKELENAQAKEKEINEKSQKLSNEINEKDNKIIELSDKNKKYENDINQCKKTIDLLKKNVQDKDKTIQKLVNQMKETERNIQQKSINEKTTIKTQYEILLKQNKEKIEDLHKLLLKVNSSFEESQQRVKNLVSTNSHLSIEVQQTKARIESIKQEHERDQKLMEAKLKASILSREMESQNLIEELKGNYELDKKKMLSFIANEFHQYYNVDKFYEEDFYQEVIHNVKKELQRLSTQEVNLRKILGISSLDSLENCVSHLFINLLNNH